MVLADILDFHVDARLPRSLSERAADVVVRAGQPLELEIPRSASTNYLTHGVYRYAGKLPPQLTAFLLNEYSRVGDRILDPMSGGGTTAIEAVSSGRSFVGFDVNPVSRLVSRTVATPADVSWLPSFVEELLLQAGPVRPSENLVKYFSPESFGILRAGLDAGRGDVASLLMLSVARRASFANTKKINTVVDPAKTPPPVADVLRSSVPRFLSSFQQLSLVASGNASVEDADATNVPLADNSVDFVLLHPPYLTNTAFSEVTELQLELLGFSPKQLRNRELANRGSYFQLPNGLRKYLVGWFRILAEAARVVRPGGHIAIVNGDGRIDGVRIPIAAITGENAVDLGLSQVFRGVHVLNNHTGLTLSRRMTGQHVMVFSK